MKKFVSKKVVVLFALVLTALSLAAVAYAVNAPGNLSGGGDFSAPTASAASP